MKENFSLGFTLVEVLVGILLFSIVFLGIFGAFWLGFKVVGLGERKITATQIAQGEIEKIRNMPYLDVGTIGASLPFASGTLEAVTTTKLNGIDYRIERKVKYVYDPSDGEEECQLDYKKVEIKVSFTGVLRGEVFLETDIMPKDKIEEIAACLQQPAGILSIQVLNAVGEFVSSPVIQVFNSQTGNLIDLIIPSSGKADIALAPGSYKVVVSKEGYSVERTYSSEEIAIPEKPNPIVLEGQITQITFLIDQVSSILVKTFSTYGQEFFTDSFDDESKISQKENVSIFESQVTLATDTQGYLPSGYLLSNEISPQDLIEWGEFSFFDEEPEETDLKYQVFFASGTEWILIPDSDLAGNSAGFDESPISLSNLSTTTYSSLILKANFSTQSNLLTPILKNWQLSWKTQNPVSINNVSFDLKGEKIIGRDIAENPIYKFSTTTQTDSSGQILISNLEWDIYHFSNFSKNSQSLELATSTPANPTSLVPNSNLEIYFYFESQNSLLVTVQDIETLQPIFSSMVTLTKSGFSQTQYTGNNGQTIFIPLESGNYNLTVEATGYSSTSTMVSIFGKKTINIKLEPTD